MKNTRTLSRVLAAWFALCMLLLSVNAGAAGPGLPNLTYSSTEVLKPISIIQSAISGSARGEGTVQMHDGYLFVPFGRDSGVNGGGFSFYDISNPRAPVKVSQTNVTALREPHGFGFSNSYPGKYAVMQAITGIQFWDFTNALAPTLLKSMILPGIAESDYDLGAWWAFWQAPYVYVGGSANGLYIIDATDPRNPVYVKTIPPSTWGGFRIGPTFAVGNLLTVMSTDGPGIATLDISNPISPKLLASLPTSGGIYAGIVNGDRVITAGTDNLLRVYSIANPSVITQTVQSVDVGGKGGYVSIQGGFAHAGFSTTYAKVNLTTGAIAAKATSGISGRDEDFGTVLGNLVFIGNDHAQGSALVPHQTGPWTTAPAVNMVSPKNNATNQATTSRVGLSLTDHIDLRTVSTSTFIVRPVGGSALAGKYSGQSGILNFSPTSPLASGTTYEVVVTAGGMKNDVGTGVTGFTSRFTTAGGSSSSSSTSSSSGGGPVGCTLSRSPALVNTSVTFTPTTTSGSTLQYAWNFGDGTATTPFSTTASVNHTYAAAGHYPVILNVRNAANTDSSTCSATQTIYTQPAPAATAPRSSGTIAYDATRNRIWVVNSDTNTVTAINAATNAKLLEKAVGVDPQTIAQAPDGRIWVTNFGSDSISILDRDTGNALQTVNLARGSEPYGVVFNPAGTEAYVSLQGSGRLLKLNVTSGAILANLAIGPTPRGIAVSGNSSRILVTRYISPVNRGEIYDVNASAFTLTRTIALAIDTSTDSEANGRGVPNFITSIAIQPDGKRAWIPSKKDNVQRGLFRDGLPLTFENTVRPIVSQIDLTTNAEVISSRVDLNDREMPNAVSFSPLGDYAFVSTQGTNIVEVMDAYSRQVVSGIVSVGLAPRGLLMTPNGTLYIQNFLSRNVAAYNANGILDGTTNTATKITDISTVATETLSSTVLAGKRIFYNSDDRRMSRDKYLNCASCHQDGGQDGRVFDFTDRGEGLRNTTTLNGKRGTGQGNVHWTGNFDEIQDFENDIRNAFGGLGFMTDAQFNTGTRSQSLGDKKAGVSADLDALAAYVTTLGSVGRSPFRNADGSLTAEAALGKQIFDGVGQCASCHSGPDFTNSAAGVLFDVGTIKPSSGKRLGGPLTGIDVPTLKGLWKTAPYLHDGSATTLLDVILANTAGKHGTTGGLTSTQQQQLVAYLQQIDDTPVGGTVSISNLSAKDTANVVDWSVQSDLQAGSVQYGDRTFALTTVPAVVAGGQWIRTANDSKAFTGNPTVTFTISQAADVYVGVDNRIGTLSWMTGWTNTGVTLVNNETTPRSFTLFKKNFVAGTVSLGPSTSAGSMYTVVVK